MKQHKMLKAFYSYNTNCNGLLSKDKLLNGIISYLGEAEENRRIDYLFLSLDRDNCGFIEYDEFLRTCLDKETI